jgi:hypothetical protein
MSDAGVIITMTTIALLTATIAALIAGFVAWLDAKKITAGIMTGGTTFLTVTVTMMGIFTTVGPLK